MRACTRIAYRRSRTATHTHKPASYCISGRRSPPPATSHTSWPAATQKRRYVRLRGNRRGMAGDGAPDMASLAGDTGECVYSTYVYTPAGVKLILKRVRKVLAILDIGSNPPKLLDDHLLYRRRYGRLRCTGGVAGNGYSAQLGISCLCIPKTAVNAVIWCTGQTGRCRRWRPPAAEVRPALLSW